MSIGIYVGNMSCKYCLSEAVKPPGSMRGKKMVKCIDCGKRFIENGNLPSMRVNKHAIVTAISLYYEGLSVRKVSRQLENIFGEKVSQVTIWKWVQNTRSWLASMSRPSLPS